MDTEGRVVETEIVGWIASEWWVVVKSISI